jgi:uncharacterized membrane protein
LSEYLMLGLACLAFVGGHFLMSHPMRAGMVRVLNPGGFALAYSAVSLGLFYWMIVEFNAAPKTTIFWPVGDVIWGVASLLTLIAAILFVGSFVRNPSFPGASEKAVVQEPFGVFKVTRHPMMWSFALWALAHILVAPRIDNFIFSGSIIFLALVGAKAQELKKAKLVGVEWDAWLRKTNYGLYLTALVRTGALPWIAGLLLWAGATWAHNFFGAYGAGLFRWING